MIDESMRAGIRRLHYAEHWRHSSGCIMTR